jgi:hypothetical protein
MVSETRRIPKGATIVSTQEHAQQLTRAGAGRWCGSAGLARSHKNEACERNTGITSHGLQHRHPRRFWSGKRCAGMGAAQAALIVSKKPIGMRTFLLRPSDAGLKRCVKRCSSRRRRRLWLCYRNAKGPVAVALALARQSSGRESGARVLWRDGFRRAQAGYLCHHLDLYP